MTIIIGRATIPKTETMRIEGSNDMFLIEGTVEDEITRRKVLDNVRLIREGEVEHCSFTTDEGIPVRCEELRITELSVDGEDESSGLQISSGFRPLYIRIVLIPQGAHIPPAEFIA